MRIALFILLFLPFGAIAGRSYTINFTVINDVTNTPLEGVRIVCGEESSIAFETDKFGNAAYVDCKHEWLAVTITAEGFYKQNVSVYSKKAKVDKELTIRMIPTDRLNISVAKLAEMETIKATYTAVRETEIRRRLELMKDLDTNELQPCPGETDSSDQSAKVTPEMAFPPEFPGGVSAMHQFIVRNLEYPECSIEHSEQGKIYLSFSIEKDGSVSNIKVDRGVSLALDNEARRLLYGMPKWVPGYCNGRPVRTQKVRLPLVFTLD